MHRLVAVLFGVALALSVAPAAGAVSSRGRAPDGVEHGVFVDYATANAAQPTADASSTDFHLLGGHPSWATSSVGYSVDASGCTGGGCAGATTAVMNAFNTWQGVSGITFNEGTADANPCGGT